MKKNIFAWSLLTKTIIIIDLGLSNWTDNLLESTSNPTPLKLRPACSKQPAVGGGSSTSKPKGCQSSGGFGFRNPTETKPTQCHLSLILSLLRFGPNLTRSRQDSSRSNLDPSRFGEILTNLAKYRLDLNKSGQISTLVTKPKTNWYNPKPKKTWTSRFDKNFGSVLGFVFTQPNILGRVLVGHKLA